MANKRNTKTPGKRNVVAQARAGGKAPSRPLGKVLWENFKSLAGAVAIYLVVRTLFVEAFRIPSGSMIPTLLVGDWLFVNKLAYGPTIPFTNSHLPGYTTPKHGDVVVFESPYQPDNEPDFTPTLVKRLIGMPGDTLYMREGQLYLNGIPQRQTWAHIVEDSAYVRRMAADDGHVERQVERMRNGQPTVIDTVFDDFKWQHTIEVRGSRFGAAPAQPTHDNWGPLLIPPNFYFMMGDNRYCSKDSRYWGIVPKQNVRGRPIFVYYSYVPGSGEAPCDGQISDNPLPAITDIRWRRLGHIIK